MQNINSKEPEMLIHYFKKKFFIDIATLDLSDMKEKCQKIALSKNKMKQIEKKYFKSKYVFQDFWNTFFKNKKSKSKTKKIKSTRNFSPKKELKFKKIKSIEEFGKVPNIDLDKGRPSNPFKKKTFEEVFKGQTSNESKKKSISGRNIDEIKEKFIKEIKNNTSLHRFSKKHIPNDLDELSKAFNFKERKTKIELNLLKTKKPLKSKFEYITKNNRSEKEAPKFKYTPNSLRGAMYEKRNIILKKSEKIKSRQKLVHSKSNLEKNSSKMTEKKRLNFKKRSKSKKSIIQVKKTNKKESSTNLEKKKEVKITTVTGNLITSNFQRPRKLKKP